MTKITITELRSIVNAALDDVERFRGSECELEGDFYRADFYDNPYTPLDMDTCPAIGSHSDEIEFLRSALADKPDIERSFVVMLSYIAGLLLGIRHRILELPGAQLNRVEARGGKQ